MCKRKLALANRHRYVDISLNINNWSTNIVIRREACHVSGIEPETIFLLLVVKHIQIKYLAPYILHESYMNTVY